MEDTGVIDAAVTLMAREGQVKEAMDRLVKHLGTLESALQGILAGVEESEDRLGLQDAAEDALGALQNSSNAQANGRVLTTAGNNMSFLRILREFLAHAAASSPNLADLRAVLASIFSAYAYEELILRLSNRLLERSLFVNVKQSVQLRQRGWRPKGSTCEACGRRVWGPGVSGREKGSAYKHHGQN
ncbi:hypothetical protein HYQ46_007389 [Verticillium longisporum]|nr:hypothetical protein HYQ46_007389 [Verticillium longisporum]